MKKESDAFQPMELGSVAELIKRRRLQVLVHSCIYYELDNSIIDDAQFDKWCYELVDLMKDNPDAYSDRFDQYFEKFTGETGFDLPTRDPWVYSKAQYLLETHNG